MAEECHVGMHPGEALAEVREKSHARHSIRSKIQKVEAVGVHDVIEEIGERGTEPAGEVVNKEWIPIWGGLSAIGGDDVCGWMPRRLSPRLAPPQGLEAVPELEHIDRRGKVGGLRPLHRQRTLRWLRRPGIFGHSLALGRFGSHGGCKKQGAEESEGAAAASEGESSRRRKKGGGDSEIGEDAGKAVK